jgi:hypothetical protein
MKAEELLKGLDFSYDYFTKLTGTGIEPDNVNIAQFAEDYLDYKLNLLGISGVGSSNKIKYKKGFDLAMKYIEESPCDPDILDEQLKAWTKLQDFINEPKDK